MVDRRTKNVEIFEEWCTVDVLTCAAPNLRSVPSNRMNPCSGTKPAKIEREELRALLLSRVERIFKVAAANGAEVLILGAFGCGAFCNPPEIVSEAFATVQRKYDGYFDVIEYAVFCRGRETQNYDAFCRVSGGRFF